ncbi:NAD-dependent epimerase/dehydratase family protein [Nocardioides aurantiacus]|uniref:NAD-dependent epimerase/dehydratase family protein n=1 Tax=Nocardioides aurantiacus TaxID=86796 RepID=UPI002482E166|nr:NAD(P)-dependent oxidoreductase [Nocardioides aurantiacus]
MAGATGAIGRPLVAQLLQAGHEVVGTSRSPARAETLRSTGAEAVVLDAFDSAALRAAVLTAAPDVVVHQLTSLGGTLKPRRYDEWIATTNRLRTEVTPILLDAAYEAGAHRAIVQSVSFMLAFEGPPVGDETSPDARHEPPPFGPVVQANLAMESAVTAHAGLEGLVLRYGYFYGPGTSIGRGGQQYEDLRRRRLPIVGTGAGLFSLVHVDDAAAATVQALDHGTRGVYNIVDDEPAPKREWMPALAAAAGGKSPHHVPTWLARLAAGNFLPKMAEHQRGSSSFKARTELDWAPRYPSWRDGFTAPGALG